MVVTLAAPWTKGTTILHEAAELVDSFEPSAGSPRSLMWDFLEAWIEDEERREGSDAEELSSRSCFGRVASVARTVLSRTQLKVSAAPGVLAVVLPFR